MAAGGFAKSRHGLRPRKKLGQHFLRDRTVIQTILAKAGFGSDSHVLEVGAGLGALTLPLARSVGRVYAVEKDGRLVERLEAALRREAVPNVSLIHRDILKLELAELPVPSAQKLGVIGNLPYNISTPLLERLITNRARFSRAVLMFQHEVGCRMIASPGSREYGSLSVLIQYHARVSPLLQVSREAFYPRPEVNAMVLSIDFENPYPRRAEDEENFKKVVRAAFAHRRKTLLNSFRGSACAFPGEVLLQALRGCGIDPGRRAETLHIDDFLCLSAHLKCLP
ncbi:MAG: 16S rRNA (adenine(1518)-N(6)/adenine(1519)-N(6))-dimethyltransferase RsmA [Thermodesulfobacteriota bacterium]